LPGCALVTYSGGDCGYNVPTQAGSAFSELAHLFHVTLGNQAAYDEQGGFRGWAGQGSSWGLSNTAHFEGLQASAGYWGATGVSNSNAYAWWMGVGLGYQAPEEKSVGAYALAVRDGDVLMAAPVPEPSPARC